MPASWMSEGLRGREIIQGDIVADPDTISPLRTSALSQPAGSEMNWSLYNWMLARALLSSCPRQLCVIHEVRVTCLLWTWLICAAEFQGVMELMNLRVTPFQWHSEVVEKSAVDDDGYVVISNIHIPTDSCKYVNLSQDHVPTHVFPQGEISSPHFDLRGLLGVKFSGRFGLCRKGNK